MNSSIIIHSVIHLIDYAVALMSHSTIVPARLLCDFLDIYDLVSIRIAHYEAGSHRNPTARLASPLPTPWIHFILDDRTVQVDLPPDPNELLRRGTTLAEGGQSSSGHGGPALPLHTARPNSASARSLRVC